MRDPDGNLTEEAVDLLNKAAVENPHTMYPLSSLAADMGRDGLIKVVLGDKVGWHRVWAMTITDAGWPFVTAPNAIHRHNKEIAFKRLGGEIAQS